MVFDVGPAKGNMFLMCVLIICCFLMIVIVFISYLSTFWLFAHCFALVDVSLLFCAFVVAFLFNDCACVASF